MSRKRKTPRTLIDLSAPENERVVQESAFPIGEDSSVAEEINRDAKEKERIAEAARNIPEIFTPEQVKWVFDVYVGILCFVYSIILKTDFAALQKELEFDEEQKNSMAVPLAKICSKYAPSSWAGMSAEIQLVSQLGLFTIASFQRAKNVAREQEEKKVEKTVPVQPMHRRTDEVRVPA
jgi:hypothetical protein